MLLNHSNSRMCCAIQKIVESLPAYRDPEKLPFKNGIYLFYEASERSGHAPRGRIVRVGNHPRSQGRLQGRLRDHYDGDKNFSVFRKFLGGALLRRRDRHHSCLKPGPGKGHWEKQDARSCVKCRRVERQVSNLLRDGFKFRCVEIRNKSRRNALERKLIGSLSGCAICGPSARWLGRHAYNEKVRRSGLWNANHVWGQDIMSPWDLALFRRLVGRTVERWRTTRQSG